MALTLGSITRGVNSVVVALTEAPVIGTLMRRGFVELTYVGRRSGRTFKTPVFYSRKGDTITIGVAMPDNKKWWRNFLGEGGPISLHLDGADRGGHATARRDDRGRVTVRVLLDQPN
ncbi:nitroreductase/quinone reductase family protein [Nocardia sp. NPDC052001]|uniref:nitroreductase/quinone reductase family protein n=1 Tax=Nocardia sp. NPDC052001 TaxID=3154853 RepID=UPI00341862DA